MIVFSSVLDGFLYVPFQVWFASLGPKLKNVIRQLVLCIKLPRKYFQDGFKRLKIASTWPQDSPKRAQDGAKMASRCPNMAFRIAKISVFLKVFCGFMNVSVSSSVREFGTRTREQN